MKDGLFSKADEAARKYNEAAKNEADMISKLLDEIEELDMLKPSTETADGNVTFSTDYGRIEVIWLSGATNNVTSTANAPDLYNNGLTPVTWTWDETNQVWNEDATAKTNYYNYKAGTGLEDNTQSEWVNAKNTDGSYFVWIPRYAYRITYYENETSTTPTGYYDGYGMWRASDGKLRLDIDRKADGTKAVETVKYNGKHYIVHPAFETNVDQGGWDKQLTGFWVAKYEMSKETKTEGNWNEAVTTGNATGNVLSTKTSNAINNTSETETIRAVSKPNVSSWRAVNIGIAYSNAYYYDRTKESHLMKNSEWGAVAYLAHSQFGRNGIEIDVNNSSAYKTGIGGDSPTAIRSDQGGETFEYYTEKGMKASTTGNIYGVYDMNGGAWDMMASYNEIDNGTEKVTYGSSFATESSSNKYATIYSNSDDVGIGNNKVYKVSKVGDAVKEVSKGGKYSLIDTTQTYCWYEHILEVVRPSRPFSVRGGVQNSWLGMFSIAATNAPGFFEQTFRVVLCP